MRIAARHWLVFGAMLLVLAPLLLLRAERVDFAFRTPRPAYNLPAVRPRPANTMPAVRPRGLTQQELIGIDPNRLILYTPMPDRGVLAIPQR